MSQVEPRPYRFGRLALRCWLISVGLFVLAFFVGIIASITGPGDDSVRTYAPIFYPGAVGLVTTPLLIVAVVLSIRSFVTEGANVRAVFAHVLSLLALIPAVLILFFAATLMLKG
jgi:hypothetical protein